MDVRAVIGGPIVFVIAAVLAGPLCRALRVAVAQRRRLGVRQRFDAGLVMDVPVAHLTRHRLREREGEAGRDGGRDQASVASCHVSDCRSTVSRIVAAA